MGIISYIITLINNSEIFIKILLSLIIFFSLYVVIILTKIYLELKKEEKILLIIKNKINCSNILKEKIRLKKINKSNTYDIYLSGIREFTKLYKNGINDIHIALTLIKNAMTIKNLNKNFYTEKIKTIKFIIKYFIMLYSIMSLIYYQDKILAIYQNLNSINITLKLNEILIPIIMSLLILVKIKIMENIFANLNFKIYNEKRIFIKNFLIILYHKFYD